MQTVQTNSNVITIENLTKEFSKSKAVDSVSLSVPKGIVMSLLGPNGAGKSTTIKMISCVLVPTSGSISILSRNLKGNERWIKNHIGVVPQENNLDPDFNTEENLAIYGFYHGMGKKISKVKIEELLDFVKLKTHRKKNSEKLSGGMKRRLILARALLNDPEILILDEPTTGLDVQSRYAIWDMIKELRSKGKTILLTTHYMAEAEALSDQVVIMDHGKIIAEGSVQELRNLVYDGDIMELEETNETFTMERLESMGKVEERGGKIFIYIKDWNSTFESLGSEVKNLPAFRIRSVTLEDVFVKLTGKELRENA